MLKREDLDEYLVTSRYGENQVVFTCYFTRSHPTGPPLCASCGRGIGEHPSRNAAMMAASPPVLASTVLPIVAAVGVPPPPPANLTLGTNTDEIYVPVSRVWVILPIVLGFLSIIMIVAYAASGLAGRAPYVMIAPCFLILFSGIMLIFARSTRITIHKWAGPNSRVEVVTRHVFGCASNRETTIAGLGPVVCRATNVRVNGQHIFEVICLAADGSCTPLYQGNIFEANLQYVAWQAYFAQYGVASSDARGFVGQPTTVAAQPF
jgi:hypothetical protein